MSCETVVLASDTAPVREVVEAGATGLLAGFDDVEGLTRQALQVLEDPEGHRHLARKARQRVVRDYALDVTYPRFCALLERTLELEGVLS